MTLLILAAGMGSRYGGLKQIDPVTDNGEFIIDFSVYDAVVSGFDKIVFVIKEENLELFRETIGKRFEGRVNVEYAFQKLDDLPDGFSVPEGRVKPWGTSQAVLAARNIIKEPFAVINADDFYGRAAYSSLYAHFADNSVEKDVPEYCMVGYILNNTLTDSGSVARGVCEVKDGYLAGVNEMTKIERAGNVAVNKEGDEHVELALDSIVSMNCWGFTPSIFEKLERGFAQFLKENNGDIKKEYYLPMAVGDFMANGECTVKVYPSKDAWYGVTYREDRDNVVNSLAKLKSEGVYPAVLNETK